jgi:hypothetical protein
MKTNKKISLSISEANLDSWLAATGYLYPFTESQLDIFNNLYENYDYKLKDAHIDVGAIISNKIRVLSNQTIPLFDNAIIDADIQPLRMAARKGENDIPDEIIHKMRQHHKKDEE